MSTENDKPINGDNTNEQQPEPVAASSAAGESAAATAPSASADASSAPDSCVHSPPLRSQARSSRVSAPYSEPSDRDERDGRRLVDPGLGNHAPATANPLLKTTPVEPPTDWFP